MIAGYLAEAAKYALRVGLFRLSEIRPDGRWGYRSMIALVTSSVFRERGVLDLQSRPRRSEPALAVQDWHWGQAWVSHFRRTVPALIVQDWHWGQAWVSHLRRTVPALAVQEWHWVQAWVSHLRRTVPALGVQDWHWVQPPTAQGDWGLPSLAVVYFRVQAKCRSILSILHYL